MKVRLLPCDFFTRWLKEGLLPGMSLFHGSFGLSAQQNHTVQTSKHCHQNFLAIPHLIHSNSCRNVLYVLNVEQHRKRKNIFRLYCVIYSKTSPPYVRTFPLYRRLDSAAFVSVANSVKWRCKRRRKKCLHSSEGLSKQWKLPLLSGRTGESYDPPQKLRIRHAMAGT